MYKPFLKYYFIRAEKQIKHCRIKLEGRLYTIGVKQFESLVELIKFYEHNYLYKKIKLCYPVNEDVVQRLGPVSITHIILLINKYLNIIIIYLFLKLEFEHYK